MGQVGDVDELINHPFFKGIDFEKLQKKELQPPYTPELSGPYDLRHFDC